MTDRVQKIREEVVGIINSINLFAPDEDGKNSSYEEGRLVVASQILQIIDSMQEEPVSIDFEKELYKAFGQLKDFTLGMRIAKWFYDMGKNSQEPVGEELNEAAIDYAESVDYQGLSNAPWSFVQDIFKAGAIWQKELFEKNRLEHCDSITEEQYNLEVGFIDQHLDKYNRMPTFLDAIEYGMKVQKQQMMAKAIDGEYWDNNILLEGGIRGMYDDGDKVKIIVIKEG